MMGSPDTEPCRQPDREDLHPVTLTHPFEIQSTEVNQIQFSTVMGYNPSAHKTCGSICPVEQVTWHEAAAYCNALSARKGLKACYTCTGAGSLGSCEVSSGTTFYACEGYRLPTEAEWEYAYRAGTKTAFYSGERIGTSCEEDSNADLIGWYLKSSGNTLHQVGMKQENAWGLFDMAGNVREWCQDGYQASLGSSPDNDPLWPTQNNRVVRGGAYVDKSGSLRGATRFSNPEKPGYAYLGFRCVRSI